MAKALWRFGLAASEQKMSRLATKTEKVCFDEQAVSNGTVATVEVFVLYEDRATGLRAKRALDLVQALLGNQFVLQSSFWRFDLFGEPAFRREAANAAVGADMVLLSAHGHEEMPEAASNWLERWFERQSGEPPAIIASFDDTAGESSQGTSVLRSLGQITVQAGSELYAYSDLCFTKYQAKLEAASGTWS